MNFLTEQSQEATEPVQSVDDFDPEERLDAAFLDDTKDVKTGKDTVHDSDR